MQFRAQIERNSLSLCSYRFPERERGKKEKNRNRVRNSITHSLVKGLDIYGGLQIMIQWV